MEAREVSMGLATIISLAGLALASSAIPLSIYGYTEAGLRLLFLAYLADILDGWVARKRGESSELGFMLDRAIDRVSQVIAPLIIYLSWLTIDDILHLAVIVLYSSLIITTSIYRLVYRGVRGLEYFSGLPMFFHAGILITASIAKLQINPIILISGAVLSLAPIRYFRRIPKKASNPSPAVLPRAILVLIMALVPYDLQITIYVAKLIYYSLLVYMVIGPLLYIIYSTRTR